MNAHTRCNERIRELLSREQPCALCGGAASVRGAFVPDDPALWGAPIGKRRVIFYQLCARCFAIDPDVRAERIEHAIAARFAPACEAAA